MSRIIEAKAVISAEDRTGAVLDRIGRKFRDVGKGAKVSAEVDKLNRSLGNTRAQLDAIGRVNAARAKVDAAKLGLSGAQARADRIAAALDAANHAKDKVRAAELAAQQKDAQKAVLQGTRAVERQTAALQDARRGVQAFGVPIGNLVAHERALQASVAKTTAAIKKQTSAERDRERFAEVKALKHQRRQEAIERALVARPEMVRPAGKRSEPGRSADRRRRGAGDRSDRLVEPLVGGLGTYEAVEQYKKAAAFDRRMTLIGQTADASRSEIDGLAASVHNLAQETATPVDNLAGGLESLVAQGRDLKEAMEFLPSVARTAAASGSAVDDIAKTADSVGSNFKVVAKEMQDAFDIMAAGGKAGQFELRDMARYLPSLGPATAAIGFAGKKGLADLVAMLQVMRKGSGTAEEAVSSMTNILNKMESDKTTKGFKDLGIDAKKAFADARKEGRNLVEVFEELLQKATKGDKSKIGEIIDDQEFKRGALALMAFRGEWQKLSKTLQTTSGGTVKRDIVQVTQDAQARVDRISNTYQRLMQALTRTADASGLTGRLSGMAGELETVARAMESVNDAWAKGGVKGLLDLGGKAAADAKAVVDDKLKQIRIADAEKNVGTQDERIRLKEAEIARVRSVVEGGGPFAGTAGAKLALLEKELVTLRKGLSKVERDRERAKYVPPDIQPNRPSVADGVPSLLDRQYKNKPPLPFPQTPTPIPVFRTVPLPLDRPAGLGGTAQRTVPLPPQRPAEFGGGSITAEVKSLPPLSGEVTGQGTLTGTIKVEPSQWLVATVTGLERTVIELKGKVSSMGSNGPGSTGKSSPDAGKGGR